LVERLNGVQEVVGSNPASPTNQVPNSKLQHPEKLQVAIFKAATSIFWSLKIGISLKLGCWNLVLASVF
jgi:hypothetical protein